MRLVRFAALSLSLVPALALAQPTPGPCAGNGDPLGELCSILDSAMSHSTCEPGPISADLRTRVADGTLSAADVKAAFALAAKDKRHSECEMAEIRAALAGGPAYTVDAAATAAAIDLAYEADLFAASKAKLAGGKTYGGTAIPAEVKKLIATAKLNGAVVYDVEAVDSDGEGIYSHYPATAPAKGNMAFSYTEITPKALADDMALTGPQTYITGQVEKTNTDGTKYTEVTYGMMDGGTGGISANYDEAWHENLYARGRGGDKWANNFGILSDGSIHALPAARRSDLQDVILTNPGLSRGQQMMFNGHLDVREGVVVGVEMSGIISKRAARGRDVIVDPIALLKAWGFKLAPGLTIDWGNTERGVPTRDEARGVIGAAPGTT